MNRSTTAASLVTADIAHRPFDMAELSFNIVRRPHPGIAVQQ